MKTTTGDSDLDLTIAGILGFAGFVILVVALLA